MLRVAREPICTIRSVERTKPPAYLFSNHQCQRARDKIEPTALSLSARPASIISMFCLPPALLPSWLRPVWRTVGASAPPVRGYLRMGAGARKGFFAERSDFLRSTSNFTLLQRLRPSRKSARRAISGLPPRQGCATRTNAGPGLVVPHSLITKCGKTRPERPPGQTRLDRLVGTKRSATSPRITAM